jgi:uncharacterized membrane protein required for colicin V production
MTIYDMAMIGAVIAGVVWGFWRGITWQLASIASLVLGYSASRTLSEQLAPHFPGEPVVARALAMIVIYAAVSGGVFLVAWIVRTTLRKLQFEAYDRHLGMMLGAIEGGLLGLIVTLFVVSLAPQTRGPIFSSFTGKLVGQVMATLGPVLPGEARRVLAPFWDGEGAGAAPDAESLANEPERDPLPEPVVQRPIDRDETRQPVRSTRSRDFDRSTPPPVGELLEGEKAKIGRAIADEVEGVRGQARDAARSKLKDVDRSRSAIGDLIEEKKAKLTRAIVDEVKGVRDQTRDAARSKLKSVDQATPSLGELFDKGEEKIGRAIADKIEQELQQVGTSDSNGRSPQRR